MVHLEGEIINSQSKYFKLYTTIWRGCEIQLKLTNIKVTVKNHLCDTSLDYRKKSEHDENFTSSVLIGILGCVIGLIVGRIIGGILSWILSIFTNQSNIVTYIVMIICAVLGYYLGFITKRN